MKGLVLTMTNKITNASAIEFVLTNCELPTEYVEKLEKIKASFEKKASGERKPTANQIENAEYKTAIVNFLADGEKYTIGDLLKKVPQLAENDKMTNQRVSAIVRSLITDGVVVREEIKRKAYFSLI